VGVVNLTEEVSARLAAAGFTPDDPALAFIRAWNRVAAERQIVRVELRRGQFGMTRTVRLDDIEGDAA